MTITDLRIDGGVPFDWGRVSAEYARSRSRVWTKERLCGIFEADVCQLNENISGRL